MFKKYTLEEFWKLYEKLPQDIKEIFFAKETGDYIYETCKKNGILENLEEVVNYVGQVLLGILPPENFQKTLEKELNLEKEVAKKIYQEIHRLIFFPVKESLANLYGKEIIPIAKPITSPPSTSQGSTEKIKSKEKSIPPKTDIYREPIE